jgi:hypothetical protein
MSSAAPSVSLRKLFSELEQLFQTETEARVSTSVQAAERALAENLNQSIRRLRQADSFSAIAATLCDASAPFAKSCAVFHVSEGVAGVERVRGGGPEAEERSSEPGFPLAEAAAFSSAVESGDPVVAICSAAEVSRAVIEIFGHASDDKAFLFPLTVDRTTVGVFYASGAVSSAALELLTQTAAVMLEARQRPVRLRPVAAASDLVRIEGATGHPMAPQSNWESLSPADKNLHFSAQRFARVQVAEMRLYRADAVKAGRSSGDLYTALQDAIDEGREAFRQNFVSATRSMVDYFHLELVRTLANDNPAWLGEAYPGPLVHP